MDSTAPISKRNIPLLQNPPTFDAGLGMTKSVKEDGEEDGEKPGRIYCGSMGEMADGEAQRQRPIVAHDDSRRNTFDQ